MSVISTMRKDLWALFEQTKQSSYVNQCSSHVLLFNLVMLFMIHLNRIFVIFVSPLQLKGKLTNVLFQQAYQRITWQNLVRFSEALGKDSSST